MIFRVNDGQFNYNLKFKDFVICMIILEVWNNRACKDGYWSFGWNQKLPIWTRSHENYCQLDYEQAQKILTSSRNEL